MFKQYFMKKSLRKKGFAGRSADCLVIGNFEGKTVVLFLDCKELGLATLLDKGSRVWASINEQGRVCFPFEWPKPEILYEAWLIIKKWANEMKMTVKYPRGWTPW